MTPVPPDPEQGSAVIGPGPLYVCACCGDHSDRPLVWGPPARCPVCGRACSCEGCHAEQEPDYRVMWEEAARHALAWRARFESLWNAVDEYNAWEPGRAGYAAARRELLRVWLSVDDPDVGER